MIERASRCDVTTYGKSCSPDHPLVVEAAAGVRITGTLDIAGHGGIFHGFAITGGVNIAGDHNRITRALNAVEAN